MAVHVADLKASIRMEEVIGRDVRLIRRGREYVGLCPFHSERTPSFTVAPLKGFWHCFGCGAHGDVVAYLMLTRNLNFLEALAALGPEANVEPLRPRRKPADSGDAAQIAQARTVLAGCGPVAKGTASWLYLWSRGLPVTQPDLRNHPSLFCKEIRAPLPALVAPITSSANEVTAVQRIWCLPRLEVVGSAMPPDTRAPLRTRKATLGRMRDGAVRLGEPTLDGRLGLAEGVETAIAASACLNGTVPVWATCGLTRLGFPAHWRQMVEPGQQPQIWVCPEEPPPGVDAIAVEERTPTVFVPLDVQELTIFGDNGAMGRIVALYAARWFNRFICDAVAVFPREPYSDFNEQLIGGSRR
jgi:CHC2 zinc finger